MDAAHRVLDQLGLGEHRASALVYYHPADFVYIVVDRVHPESGYITPVNDDPHKLGVWLSNYEQEHEPSSAVTQALALREHERPQSVGELQSMLAEPETSAGGRPGRPPIRRVATVLLTSLRAAGAFLPARLRISMVLQREKR